MPGVIRDPRQNNPGGRAAEHRFGIVYVYGEEELFSKNTISAGKSGGAYFAYDKIQDEEKKVINLFRRELQLNDKVLVSGPISLLPNGFSLEFDGNAINHTIEIVENEYFETPGQASHNKKAMFNRIMHGITTLEDQETYNP